MGHIAQVITNLLSNAIKYTDRQRNIDFSIEHEQLMTKNKIEIPALKLSVRDYGVGIVSDEFELVFDQFEQGSKAITGVTQGTGLGLSICKKIIEAHQGKIWAENHPQGGAIFSCIIPIKQQ